MRRLTLIFALVVAVTGIRAQGGPPLTTKGPKPENCLSDHYLSLTPDESKVFCRCITACVMKSR